MAMQAKKAAFQRMGSGGKGRTENRWDYQMEVYRIFKVSTLRRVSG